MNEHDYYEDPAVREFVASYDIEVPAEKVEQEIQLMRLELKHAAQYSVMQGLMDMFTSQREMERQMQEAPERAYQLVKTELVLKDVIRRQKIEPSQEALEAELERIKRQENISGELVSGFFDGDYSLLKRDLQIRRAVERIRAGELKNE